MASRFQFFPLQIQYTLFLKALGMPVAEAVQFWKNEYSRPPSSHHCNKNGQSWGKDGGRYVYNIRHLYGLEGSRRNYSAHCCAALQAKSLSLGDDGGCPFRHFDQHHLKDFLMKKMGIFDQQLLNGILKSASSNKCSKACSMLLESRLSHSSTISQPMPHLRASDRSISDRSISGRSIFLTQVDSGIVLDEQNGCIEHEDCKCNFGNSRIRKPQEFVQLLLNGF